MSGFSLAKVLQQFKAPRSHVLFVDDGRVACPKRGDVDFDYCLACPDLREVHQDGGLSIECSGHRPLSLEDVRGLI